MLQNGSNASGPIFVSPTNRTAVVGALKKVTSKNITYGGGSDGVPLGTSRPECVLYIDPSNFNLPGQGTYPIVTVTYLLFYGQNNGVHVSDKQALIKFLAGTSANGIVNKLEYASLNGSVHKATLNALNGTSTKKPCLQ